MFGCIRQYLTVLVCVAAGSLHALPSVSEALAAKEDVWGKAALEQSNGPSYDFFAGLLPQLRWVNAKFHTYPLVLSAPLATNKCRMLSDGSELNPRAGVAAWKETGIPISFFARPRGWAPVQLQPKSFGTFPGVELEGLYGGMELFVDEEMACFRSRPSDVDSGVVARIAGVHAVNKKLCDASGKIVAVLGEGSKWDESKQELDFSFRGSFGVLLAPQTNVSKFNYEDRLGHCMQLWGKIFDQAAVVVVPERIVNDAWRATIASSLMIAQGGQMNYSHGNAYEKLYEAESGDALRGLLASGLVEQGKPLLRGLMKFKGRSGLAFHDAAFKLQLLAYYYWLTRDVTTVQALQPEWLQAAEVLMRDRNSTNGLFPPEQYCGDETEKVFSLNADANGWRGLRDMSVVCEELGDSHAATLREGAGTLRVATLEAVKQSEDFTVSPPFIPVALFGQERAYDVLTATRRGSYYDLMAPYVLGSGIFGSGSAEETAMLRYLDQHGGVCMGMMRFDQHSGLFANENGLDDLYGLRRDETLLHRDEADLALVSFYGKLAQGMTRGTFLSAEGTGLIAENGGRPMYLPPISSGNGYFQLLLRNLLVQDFPDDDGRPRTLRLLFATPRAWLEDGKEIRVEGLPTVFGPVTLYVTSALAHGRLTASIHLPTRSKPEKVKIKFRLPAGWIVDSVHAGQKTLAVDRDGTVDLTGLGTRIYLALLARSSPR